MSGTGARRYGVEASSPELEQRLRRIEQVLTMKADANSYIDDPSAANRDVPQVLGVTVTKDINKWSLSWDPVDIPDLRKYEIIVATDQNFANVVKVYDETEIGFTFPATTGGVNYYVKVRAMNKDKWTGPWSASVSVATGQVVTGDIEPNAVTQFIEWALTPAAAIWAGSHGTGSPGGEHTEETYGPLTISTSSGSIILPFIMLDVEYQSIYGYLPNMSIDAMQVNKVTIVVNRRLVGGADTELMNMVLDFHSSIPYSFVTWFGGAPPGSVSQAVRGVTATARVNVPLLPDQPGAGTFEYRIKATAEGDTDTFIYFIPTSLRMRFFDYKV